MGYAATTCTLASRAASAAALLPVITETDAALDIATCSFHGKCRLFHVLRFHDNRLTGAYFHANTAPFAIFKIDLWRNCTGDDIIRTEDPA
jgi:hypothetical protein